MDNRDTERKSYRIGSYGFVLTLFFVTLFLLIWSLLRVSQLDHEKEATEQLLSEIQASNDNLYHNLLSEGKGRHIDIVSMLGYDDDKKILFVKDLADEVTQPVDIIKTDNLTIYYPQYSKIELVCGEMPQKEDESVIMTCAAAYTVKCRNDFSHSNIVGNHVSSGKLYSGASSDSYRGAFAFYDDSAHFAYKDWREEFANASSKGGCGFAQDMMIHNGQVVDYSRDKNSNTEFRALCLIDNKIAIVDSNGPQKFNDFVDELVNAGASEAIYLDMGNWKHSWYRDDDGQPIDIYPNPNKYGTNWITFYK